MSQIKVELQEWMGSDRSIAEAAWTSSLTYQGKTKRSDEDVKRVVNMLANDGHSTPFESVVLRFWIKMPIAIDRQHMTHRIGSHNGMSGRYRTMPSEYFAMAGDVKAILQKVPGSDWVKDYERICTEANAHYQLLVATLKNVEKNGVITNAELKRVREFYRGQLPQHNMTERITIFNLRSLANYLKLRNSPHAQPEIQEVARQMLYAVKAAGVAPEAVAALERNGWNI